MRRDQTHLTLKFLGEVRPELAARFVEVVRAQALPPAFEIEVRDVGAFPNWKRPNVFWAGIMDPMGGLSKLFLAAETAWTSLGQPSEGRAFAAHLTLARTRSDRDLAEALTAFQRHRGQSFGRANVDRANLYESTLTPQGPVYRVVEEVVLARA